MENVHDKGEDTLRLPRRKERLAGVSRKYKMVIVGEARVGKSNLLERIRQHRFAPSTRATLKCDVADIHVDTNGVFVCFEVWDTAGQEMYRGLSEAFYRNAHLCIIVYDITRRSTLKQAQWWYDELLRRAPPATTFAGEGKPPNVILVGNKSDLEHLREVSYKEGQELAVKWNNCKFCEHSAVLSQELSPFMVEVAQSAERTLKSGVAPLERAIQVHGKSPKMARLNSPYDNIFVVNDPTPLNVLQATPLLNQDETPLESECAC